MKVICDTDILIDYFNQSNPRHYQTVTILNEDIGLNNIVISAITKMELIMGIRNKEAKINS